LRAVLGAKHERADEVIDGSDDLRGRHAQDTGEKVAQNGNDPQPARHARTFAAALHAMTLGVRHLTVNWD